MNSSLFGSDNSNVESLELDENVVSNEELNTDIIVPPITDPNVAFDNNTNDVIQETASIMESKIDNSDNSDNIISSNVFEEKLNDNSTVSNSDNNVVENNIIQPVESNVENIEPVVDDSHQQFYVFKCMKCSSVFGKYGSNEINSCVYCGSTSLDTIDGDSEEIPYMLPFNYSLDDAINKYKDYIKFNPLIPGEFKNKKTISSISKVFVSSELFDIKLSGDVSFFAGDKKVNEGKEELKKFDVKNTVNFDFKDVLMCGNSKISMPIFLGISNFDFQQIKNYDSNLIGDGNILYSDLSPMDISNFASNMVMDYSLNVIRKNVNHQLKKVNKNNIKVDFSNNKSVLVPLYLLNVNYKGKVYTYIMNGSTGKTTMKLVYGKKEIIIFSIIIFVLIFIISFLFVYFI